jgi:hypothetical protein
MPTIAELFEHWRAISAELARLDYPLSPEFRYHLRRYIAVEKELMARSPETEVDLYRQVIVSLDATVDLDTDNPDAVLFRRAANAVGYPIHEPESRQGS